MSTASTPWPCPVCANLIPLGFHDCPHCNVPAAWLDLMRAVDFTIRRFHLASLEGTLPKPGYRALVEYYRQRREQMTLAAQAGRPAPANTGLPTADHCWQCLRGCGPRERWCAGCGAPLDTPEVRVVRYQTFLDREIEAHRDAGRLSLEQAARLSAEIPSCLTDVRARLRQAWAPEHSTTAT